MMPLEHCPFAPPNKQQYYVPSTEVRRWLSVIVMRILTQLASGPLLKTWEIQHLNVLYLPQTYAP